ncbi:MAG TPA: hypothetical protein VNE41_05230, partial [Chitinophagaceae bacterium]|nr:hypothetical protein [Chitinophagaceae bacterium]
MNNLKATSLRRFFSIAFFKLLILAPFNVFGQLTPVTTTVSPNCGGYWQFLPPGYNSNPTQKYPVIFFLHGLGELGNGTAPSLNKLLIYGPTKLIKSGKWPAYFTVNGHNFEFIVIAPQFKSWPVPTDITSLIDLALSKYRIDTTRMYITGLSMGGGATWDYVNSSTANARRIAAIVPVAGASYPNVQKADTIASTNLPVWALQNLNDPTVPSFYSIDYVKYLNSYNPAINPQALLTLFQASGHDSWDSAYNLNYTRNGLNVFQWMLQYTRGSSTIPPPIPPVVNPGPNITLTLPLDSTILNGSGSSAPSGSIKSYLWSQVSGTPGAIFTTPDSAITSLSGLSAGNYVFSLKVTDNLGDTASALVTIAVNSAAALPPLVVNPGTDTSLTLPADSAILNGMGSKSDSGWITSYRWNQVSGPSGVFIGSPDSAVSSLTGLSAGKYVFSLTVINNLGDSVSGLVAVTVNSIASPPPPIGS